MNTKNSYSDQQHQDEVDIKSLFFRYISFWPVFVGSVLFFLFLAFLLNNLSQPKYRVQSKVLISDASKSLNQHFLMQDIGMFPTRSGFHDQMIILQSYSLIDSVLQRSNFHIQLYSVNRFIGLKQAEELYLEAPFRVVSEINFSAQYDEPVYFKIENPGQYRLLENNNYDIAEQKVAFGSMFQSDSISFSLILSENFDPKQHIGRTFMFKIRNKRDLVKEYVEQLSVESHNRDAWVLDVHFTATHLGRAKEFVDALTAYFVASGLREKNLTALNTIRFIDEQILIATDSLFQAEASLQEFRQDRRLTDVSFLATQLLEELQALDQKRAIEEVKMQYYEYLITYMERNQDFTQIFGPSAMGIEDRLLNELIAELARLYSERARLLLTTTERSPVILGIDQKIAQARNILKENVRSIKSASRIMLDDVNRRILQMETRIQQLPQTERQLLSIQRRFNLNDATFSFLLEKRAEAGIAMASNVADNQVIDKARFDEKVSPNALQNYAISIILGILFPLGFLTLREFFNTRISDKKEITDVLNYPIIGLIPYISSLNGTTGNSPNLLENPRSHLAEAFRTMRVNLQFVLRGKGCHVLAVTSTIPSEGKSFTAKNLASILQLSGKKTVLISGDMRKAKIPYGLGESREPGLSNYLAGTKSLKDILQKVPGQEIFFIIAPGPVPPNPTELLESDQMIRLIEELKKDFDFILIDTPPVGILPDAVPAIKLADSTLIVIRHKYTFKSALDFIRDFASKTESNSICISLNSIDARTLSYGGGYGYGYGYGYGEEISPKNSK